MKTLQSKYGLKLFKTALALSLALLAMISPARATLLFSGVDLGNAGRTYDWALFALTGGITIADTAARTFDPNPYPTGPSPYPQTYFGPFSGTPTVRGNIGVAANSITISGTTKVEGTAYIKTGGLLRRSGTASVRGGVVQNAGNDLLMNSVKNDAIAASAQANALMADLAGGSITGTGYSTSVVNSTGGAGFLSAPAGAHVVLKLSDFVLNGGATLTITGDQYTTYIIDVQSNFSILGGSVVLTGGLLGENVLFNIAGTSPLVSLGAGAQLSGYILAPGRTVNLNGGASVGSSTSSGSIIAGAINISGGGTLSHLPPASP